MRLSHICAKSNGICADNKSFKLNTQNSWRTAIETPFAWAVEFEFLYFTIKNFNAYVSRYFCDIRYVECVASRRWNFNSKCSNASVEPQVPVILELENNVNAYWAIKGGVVVWWWIHVN
jgi:hypothetical protein